MALLWVALLPSGINLFAESSTTLNMGLRVAALRYAEVGYPLATKKQGVLPVFAGGKLGFTDLRGNEILVPTYTKDREAMDYYFSSGLMRVVKDGRYGFIDENLKEVIPCQYEDASDFSEGLARVKTGGLWGFVKPDGSNLCAPVYKRAVDFSCGLAAVVGENDSLGFIGKSGEMVIPCMYDNNKNPKFEGYPCGCSVSLNGKTLTINKKGEDISGAEILMSENMVGMRSDYYWRSARETLLERTKYALAATPYDEISFLSGDYLMVMKKREGKRFGALRYNGSQAQEVIPCEYDNIFGPYLGGPVDYFVVENNGKYGAYTTDGKSILPCEYQMVGTGGKKYILVEKDDKFGYVDGSGKVVVPCQFDDARPFNDEMTAVAVPKKDRMVWNFIDKTGKVVFTSEFDDVMSFENGICPVKRKGAWGFINQTGKIIVPFKYEYSFSDENEQWSYAKSAVGDPIPVSKDGKFGFIDLKGKNIIKFIYDDATAFNKITKQAKVQLQGETFFIDRMGNKVTEITEEEMKKQPLLRSVEVEKIDGKYCVTKEGTPCASYLDEVKPFASKFQFYTPVKIVNKWGLMNGQGEIVVPCIYDAVEVKGNVIIVRVLSKKGIIDAQGNSLLPSDATPIQVEWIPLPVNEKKTIILFSDVDD